MLLQILEFISNCNYVFVRSFTKLEIDVNNRFKERYFTKMQCKKSVTCYQLNTQVSVMCERSTITQQSDNVKIIITATVMFIYKYYRNVQRLTKENYSFKTTKA